MEPKKFPLGLLELEQYHPKGKNIIVRPNDPIVGEIVAWVNAWNYATTLSDREAVAALSEVSECTLRKAFTLLMKVSKKKGNQ